MLKVVRLLHRLMSWLPGQPVQPIRHEWVYDEGNSMKRTCSICGRHEWMFMRPYPSSTEPSIVWKRMYYRDGS